MTDAPHDLDAANARHVQQDGRWRRSRPVPLSTQRERLEAAVEDALAAVEAAVVELDLLDGDPELEPACEDEGAQCEDEGAGDDREPDQDGDGRPEPSWQIGGRHAHLIDGAGRSWAERQGSDRQIADMIDPDDAPDPLEPPRLGFGCAR